MANKFNQFGPTGGFNPTDCSLDICGRSLKTSAFAPNNNVITDGDGKLVTTGVLNPGFVGGADKDIQFNNLGSFDGDTLLQWDTIANAMTINTLVIDANGDITKDGDIYLHSKGTRNQACGNFALSLVTIGVDNAAFGFESMEQLDEGDRNSAFGSQSLASAVGNFTNDNAAFGFQAAQNYIGSEISAFGAAALQTNSTGPECSAFGFHALQLSTEIGNSAFGHNCLCVFVGFNATAFGAGALALSESGPGNAAFGNNALTASVTADHNSAFGDQALASAVGSDNAAFGFHAGQNSTGAILTAFGSQSLDACVGGANNAAFGYNSLTAVVGGNNNSAFGTRALEAFTGSDNSAFGRISLEQVTGLAGGGGDNCAFGCGTGFGLKGTLSTHCIRNAIFGFQALVTSEIGSNNAVFGYNAARVYLGNEASGFGSRAFFTLTTGIHNSGFGFNVLSGIDTGGDNSAFGFQAGSALTFADSGNLLLDHLGIAGDNTTTRIGTSQTTCFIAGIAEVTVAATNEVLVIDTVTGQVGSAPLTIDANGDIERGGADYIHTKGPGGGNFAAGQDVAPKLTAGTGFNTIIGSSAGTELITGSRNVLIGALTGGILTSAEDNIFIGYIAQGFSAIESNTIRIGVGIFQNFCFIAGIAGVDVVGGGLADLMYIDNTTGQLGSNDSGLLTWDNTGHTLTIGTLAIKAGNMTLSGVNYIHTKGGTGNFAAGPSALNIVGAGGSNNTCFGEGAGSAVTTGDNNDFFGRNAGSSITGTGSNNICIKNVGVAADDAVIRLGSVGAHTTMFQAGIAGIEPSGTNEAVIIDTVTGQLGSTTISMTGFMQGFQILASTTTDTVKDILPGSCRDSTDGHNFVSSGTLTIDQGITAGLIGGLDTGTVAIDTFYAIFIIADTAGVEPVAAIFSLSATAPGLPTDYDIFRRVAWGLTAELSTDWLRTEHGSLSAGASRFVQYAEPTGTMEVLVDGTNDSWMQTGSLVDCSGLIPPTSTGAYLNLSHLASSSGFASFRTPGGGGDDDPNVNPWPITVDSGSTPTTRAGAAFWIITDTSQQIEYANSSSSNTSDVVVVGYIDNLTI